MKNIWVLQIIAASIMAVVSIANGNLFLALINVAMLGFGIFVLSDLEKRNRP